MTTKTALFLTALLLSAACEEGPTRPAGDDRQPGILEWTGKGRGEGGSPDTPTQGDPGPGDGKVPTVPEALVVPDTVQAGVPFTVKVTTIGPNGCWKPGEAKAEVKGRVATITVYDHHTGANVCTEVLGYLPHVVQVAFHEPGEAIVKAVGRGVSNGNPDDAVPLTVEKKVIVRP